MRDTTVGEALDALAALIGRAERRPDLEAIRVRLIEDPPRKWPGQQ